MSSRGCERSIDKSGNNSIGTTQSVQCITRKTEIIFARLVRDETIERVSPVFVGGGRIKHGLL